MRKGKKLISWFPTFSLVALSEDLFPIKRGAQLIIQKTDGKQIRGELNTAKKSQLLLLESESGADMSVETRDIKVITIVKKSKAGKGALLGALIGSVSIAIAVMHDQSQPVPSNLGLNLPAIAVCIGGGALIGWIFGIIAGIDRTIQIEGKSDLEISKILEKLRKKARIPDYK